MFMVSESSRNNVLVSYSFPKIKKYRQERHLFVTFYFNKETEFHCKRCPFPSKLVQSYAKCIQWTAQLNIFVESTLYYLQRIHFEMAGPVYILRKAKNEKSFVGMPLIFRELLPQRKTGFLKLLLYFCHACSPASHTEVVQCCPKHCIYTWPVALRWLDRGAWTLQHASKHSFSLFSSPKCINTPPLTVFSYPFGFHLSALGRHGVCNYLLTTRFMLFCLAIAVCGCIAQNEILKSRNLWL